MSGSTEVGIARVETEREPEPQPTEPARAEDAEDPVLAAREEILEPPCRELYTALLRLASAHENRFVLCLGGGSAPGLCGNVALVRLLEELELRPHVSEIWGTSAGAVIGGSWASGTDAERLFEILRGLDRPGAVDVAWRELVTACVARAFGGQLPDALLRGDHFHDAVREALSVESIEQCSIPFRAIACADEGQLRRRIFRAGPLLPAISASMSLPGLLLARDAEGRPETGFYDGGVIERTPLISPISEHARSGDRRELVLLATYFVNDARRPDVARGFVERFMATIHGLEDQLWEHHLREARARNHGKLLVLTPSIDDPSSFDFARAERDYLEARAYYKDRLQNGKLALCLGG